MSSTDLPRTLQASGSSATPAPVSPQAAKAQALTPTPKICHPQCIVFSHSRRTIQDIAPTPLGLKRFSNSSRREDGIISQLRHCHIALNYYLHLIKAAASLLCAYEEANEMIEHFLLTRRWYRT